MGMNPYGSGPDKSLCIWTGSVHDAAPGLESGGRPPPPPDGDPMIQDDKLTDYGIVLLTHLARKRGPTLAAQSSPQRRGSAPDGHES